MKTPYTLESIQQMIETDLQISEQLRSLLEKETPAIKEKNFDSIKQILMDKAPLLDQLRQHSSIRREWLQSLYKKVDESHWLDFIGSFNEPVIQEQWHEMTNNINHCKKINESNGVLVTRGKKTYEQLLQLMKGGDQTSSLYTSKGSRQVNAYRSTVTKA